MRKNCSIKVIQLSWNIWNLTRFQGIFVILTRISGRIWDLYQHFDRNSFKIWDCDKKWNLRILIRNLGVRSRVLYKTTQISGPGSDVEIQNLARCLLWSWTDFRRKFLFGTFAILGARLPNKLQNINPQITHMSSAHQ